jgi:hypothetical protein
MPRAVRCLVLIMAAAAGMLLFQASGGWGALPLLDARDMRASRERLEENAAQLARASEGFVGLLTAEDRNRLNAAVRLPDDDEAVGAIQEVLDRYALVLVHIDEEAWFTVSPASHDPNERRLRQDQWSTYLIKVNNESRVTSPLEVRSPEAITVTLDEGGLGDPPRCGDHPPGNWRQWVNLRLAAPRGMRRTLSGREIEYFILQACSPLAGLFSANLVFYLGGGQVSQGHYADISMLFFVDESRDE